MAGDSFGKADEPPLVRANAAQARRVIRRPAGLAYSISVIGAMFCAILVAGCWSADVHVTGVLVVFAAVCALWCVAPLAAGPVAYFVVSPRSFEIYTAWRVVRIPRGLIAAFVPAKQDVRLRLTDGSDIYFAVESETALGVLDRSETFENLRSQSRVFGRIQAAWDEIEPATEPYDRSIQRAGRPSVLVGLTALWLALCGVQLLLIARRP